MGCDVCRCSGYEAQAPPSRRDFLSRFSSGFAGVALESLLARDGMLRADGGAGPAGAPHFAPRAKRAIQIFCQGGVSQVDTFDYKPELEKFHGKSVPGAKPDVFFNSVGLLHKSHFAFKRRGQSGLWVSDLFPHIASVADELTVFNSMKAEVGNHTPATYAGNSGFKVLGFPAMGAWLSYGLGSLTDNLPTFVVLPDSRGMPTGEHNNWTSAFLPARHQGVVLRASGSAVNDLHPSKPVRDQTRLARNALLERMNRRHAATRDAGADALEARIRSYQMAARMQASVPEAADLGAEPEEIKKLYGLDDPDCRDFARSALLGRRLLERGVRFVQLWSGGPFGSEVHWDAHGNVPDNHTREAKRIDRPVAALLTDLRRRGMLDDTLVIFTTEFGRTPFSQTGDGRIGPGRDHNPDAFTSWLAGAGLKHGIAYGATDDIGYKAAQDVVSVYDFHATILHLLGLDHEQLTYYHNGVRRRLTDVHGHVVGPVLA